MLPALRVFLPPHLIARVARTSPGRRLSPEVRRAALLLCDVAGFTALSERLEARGRAGAEEIAHLISRAFRPVIAVCDRWGGSIVSFGGDAVFVVFGGVAPVRRAAAAASEIRATFEDRPFFVTSRGRVRLSISQAIHFGVVHGMELRSGLRRHYAMAGPGTASLARWGARSGAGQIVRSPAASRRLRHEREATPAPVRAPRVSSRSLGPYLPPEMAALLASFEGAYVHVAVLFLESRGWSRSRNEAFFASLTSTLERYEGLLLKTDISSSGLKWICLFGLPRRHEDDAERAALAALDLVAAGSRALPVRGGLHCGTVANVLIGGPTRRSFEVMGDAVNTAARALSKAAWGQVLATPQVTSRIARVTAELQGSHAVKGKALPLELHRLSLAHGPGSTGSTSTRLAGRARELEQLYEALRAACAGAGCAVGIRGEAGMGKSRLKLETAVRARELGFDVHEGRAASFGSTAYHAIGELVLSTLGTPSHDPRRLLRVVESAAGGLPTADRHHLADVLGLRYPRSPLVHLTSAVIRTNNMIAIRSHLLARALRRPALYVLEDMHWADETTRDAAAWLARSLAGSRIVLLLLYRPGYQPPPDVEELRLAALSPGDVGEMVRDLLGEGHDAAVALVAERSEGNPLFAQELARHLHDTGEGATPRGPSARGSELPDTLEAVIGARIDRLSPEARTLARAAAVVGRSFALRDVPGSRPGEAPRSAALRELVRAGIIVRRRTARVDAYAFGHAMTRDVALSGILLSQRRRLHGRVARALEALSPWRRAENMALLGHHWQEAGAPARARPCFLRAARRAARAFALEEAERLYGAYLGLARRPSRESILARCDLAGNVLDRLGKRQAALELLEGARDDAVARRDGPALLESLRRLGAVLQTIGRLDEAALVLERASRLARTVGSRADAARVRTNLAMVLNAQGRGRRAIRMLRHALSAHRRAGMPTAAAVDLQCLGKLLSQTSRLREARAVLLASVRTWRRCGNRQGLKTALGNLSIVSISLGRQSEGKSYMTQVLAMCRRIGDRPALGAALANLGKVLLNEGRSTEAMTMLDEAVRLLRETESREHLCVVLGTLADVHSENGELERAEELYQEKLALARDMGNPSLQGVALSNMAATCLDRGDAEGAARHAEAAVGKHRDAGSLHGALHAMSTLALARGHQGRLDEARQLLVRSRRLARRLTDSRYAGMATSIEATVARWRGEVRRAARLADRGLAGVTAARDRVEQSRSILERGRCALALGEDAAHYVSMAATLLDEMGLPPRALLRRELATLEDAVQARKDGASLWHGERIQALPEGLRRLVERAG